MIREMNQLDMKLTKTNKVIGDHKLISDEINFNLNGLTQTVMDNFTTVNKKFDDKVYKLQERINVTEADNQANLVQLQATLEKLKADLTDMIESKFDYISKNVESQTKQLKETYETLSTSLQKTSEELNDSFKDKVVFIKSTVATFFAKVEKQITEN
jgi:vancomycin resistance protein YoaR